MGEGAGPRAGFRPPSGHHHLPDQALRWQRGPFPEGQLWSLSALSRARHSHSEPAPAMVTTGALMVTVTTDRSPRARAGYGGLWWEAAPARLMVGRVPSGPHSVIPLPRAHVPSGHSTHGTPALGCPTGQALHPCPLRHREAAQKGLGRWEWNFWVWARLSTGPGGEPGPAPLHTVQTWGD